MHGIVFNDLHFGIKESKRLYDELSLFKEYLSSHDVDLLVFAGDYFDCKLSLSDSAVFYAMTFFDEVIQIVRKKNIPFRMIQGTRSHDLNQLQLFKHYERQDGLDFKIIENVVEEEILGLKFLFIPEEYPENSDEYYAPFKADGKEYAAIFGHGTWDFVAPPGSIEKSQKATHSAPVFMWPEWKHTIKHGFVSFGHIHGRNIYGNKIFYSGSYSRWNYGERSEKGFTYFEYNPETLKYKVEFVNNTLAPSYDVVSVKELGLDLDKASVEEIQQALSERTENIDNVKISLSGLSKEKIEVLKESYSGNPAVKIESASLERRAALKETATDEFAKYHYITKRELPINKMIQRYCKEEFGADLTLDTIDEALKKEE